MKYFLDTEFIEYPNTIQLISIGIVCEDGRKFYAESWAIDWSKASGWVIDNVKPRLTGKNVLDSVEMKKAILEFIGNDNPEFWGYYADYDWVVFCWIFGAMIDLPKNFPMYCKDLKQLADMSEKPKYLESKNEHNALDDAEWNYEFYKYLEETY
jgi:hypothetical protein